MIFYMNSPLIIGALFAVSPLSAAAAAGAQTYEEYADIPNFLILSDSMDDFSRFADGGSDSNWYVGFNNAWIIKLPPAPAGDFTRAFVGAKLGRAKTRPLKGREWERGVLPGKIYMGISPRPAFSSEQSFFLAETADLPLQPDEKANIPGSGHAEWFWKEIPLNLVSFSESNYLIIWSPTREFSDAEHAPILAAADASPGEDGNAPRAWNNHSISGVPPRRESESLQVPINLKPAMAIKLTPAPGGGVELSDFELKPLAERIVAGFSVEGKNVELAWVEMSHDELEWRRVTRHLRHPPYFFSIPRTEIPPRGAFLRGRARDALAVDGQSKSVFVSGGGNR